MNLLLRLSISAVCVLWVWITVAVDADKSCAARQCFNESVVCVCNETYCDEIVREPGQLGKCVYYASSKCGLRFYKRTAAFKPVNEKSGSGIVLRLHPEEVFQKILGFGGSVTDAAGMNWLSLPKKLRSALIDSYFSSKGLEYNMIRTPIGGSDFSTHPYTLNDLPEGDINFCNFSLAHEDYLYKLPMLQQACEASCGKTQVLASCWSPPAWMKTNNNITGKSFLKPEYYQAYADYYLKFIETYTKKGVPIWGVTTTNEPIDALFPGFPFNSLGWTPTRMAKWIAKNLGPTLRNSEYDDIKILCGDDQRFTLPFWFNEVIKLEPEALEYIDGVAVHWYANKITPPSLFQFITKTHPDKFILATEACEGFVTNDVILGSWERAISYASDIISDLNNHLVGWIDWNLCLDERGGPNWVGNYVDSPVIVFKDKKEFVKQPTFYAMGHFSKWIQRGSFRINTDIIEVHGLEQVAFRTPEENIVVVLHNKNDCSLSVTVVIGNKEAVIGLEPYSICTVEFPFTYNYFGVTKGCLRPPPQSC